MQLTLSLCRTNFTGKSALQIVYMIIFVLQSNRVLTGFFRKYIQEQVVDLELELLVKQVDEFHVPAII